MNRGTIWQWNPRNGTGVIALDGDLQKLAWVHYSSFDDASLSEVYVGLPVEAELERTPQDEFSCRAARVRLSLPASWHY